MAALACNMTGDTTNGADAKANRKAKGSATASQAKRSAVGQRSSVQERFGTRAKAVERFQGVLRDKNSTPEERDAAKRIIASNAALGGLTGEANRRAFLTRAGFG